MKLKNFAIVFLIPLFAVSCLPFGSSNDRFGGVYKSTNSGGDWLAANTTIRETTTRRGGIETEVTEILQSADVVELAWSKAGPKRLYAAGSRQGLFISEDDAANWRNLLSGGISITGVGLDSRDASRIYASGALAGGLGRVWLTEDGGKTWQEVYADNSAITAMAVQDNGSMIAVGTVKGSVVVSFDRGQTWNLAYTLTRNIVQLRFRGDDLYILNDYDGLYLSRRGQGSLVDLSKDLRTIQLNVVEQDPSEVRPSGRPGKFWQVAFDAGNSQLMYISTDVGLFQSRNGGLNWKYVRLPVKDLQTYAGGATAVSTGLAPGEIFLGVGGSLYISRNGGQSWVVESVAQGGIIRYILPDGQQPGTMYIGAARAR